MLRGEHVMARLQRGRLLPHKLSTDGRALEVAGELCDLYTTHLNKPRSGLEEELTLLEEDLGPRLDSRRGFRIFRALAKLLEEHAKWTSPTTDPYTLRTRIFELAAALPEPPAAEPGLPEATTREDILSQVSREMGLEDATGLMYADRRGSRLLSEFDAPSTESLVARYNVAQVQGLLHAAKGLTVDLGADADARLVFHYVKKLGLIYVLEPTPSGYRLHLEGPLSLSRSTRKYGLRLSKFLPRLLLTTPWKLSANVTWKGRDALLELDSDSGLESHYAGPKEIREEDADVREAFTRAWDRAKDTGGWKLDSGPGILTIPGQKNALVPDFTFRRVDTGAEVHLEILGFWSERYLLDLASLLREAGKQGHRILVAASEGLGTSPNALPEAPGGQITTFKNRLKVATVLDKIVASTHSNSG